MKLRIADIPLGTRRVAPLHYAKIAVKSQAYDVDKFVLSGTTNNLLDRMVTTCLLDDGIGLAAPQIGTFKRLFIIRDMDVGGGLMDTFTAYFNPSFKALSNDKETALEACLSVPEGGFKVARYVDIQVTWWGLSDTGTLVKEEALLHGYEARVFQHELDHLNGISIVQRGSR